MFEKRVHWKKKKRSLRARKVAGEKAWEEI